MHSSQSNLSAKPIHNTGAYIWVQINLLVDGGGMRGGEGGLSVVGYTETNTAITDPVQPVFPRT